MIEFKKISLIQTDITSKEEFDSSEFAGCEKMLGVENYKDLVFADSQDEENDEVVDLYLFLEGNGEHQKTEENFTLVKLDEVKYVLIDLHGNYVIVTHKYNEQTAKEIL